MKNKKDLFVKEHGSLILQSSGERLKELPAKEAVRSGEPTYLLRGFDYNELPVFLEIWDQLIDSPKGFMGLVTNKRKPHFVSESSSLYIPVAA